MDEEHVIPNESDEEEDENMDGQSKTIDLFDFRNFIVIGFFKWVDLSWLLDHMYFFEGRDYSKDPSAEDEKTFELILEKQLAELDDAGKEGRSLRNKAGVA